MKRLGVQNEAASVPYVAKLALGLVLLDLENTSKSNEVYCISEEVHDVIPNRQKPFKQPPDSRQKSCKNRCTDKREYPDYFPFYTSPK